MNTHRIHYEVLETIAGTRYRATCRCGQRRDSTSHDALSSWGPKHVVDSYEMEHAR